MITFHTPEPPKHVVLDLQSLCMILPLNIYLFKYILKASITGQKFSVWEQTESLTLLHELECNSNAIPSPVYFFVVPDILEPLKRLAFPLLSSKGRRRGDVSFRASLSLSGSIPPTDRKSPKSPPFLCHCLCHRYAMGVTEISGHSPIPGWQVMLGTLSLPVSFVNNKETIKL